jgi:RES domain
MVVDLNGRFVRLAFPLQSIAIRHLVDSVEEFEAIQQLLRLTSPPIDGARAYVERPFLFPWPSRFSDGTYGVLYSANSFQTAVRETAHYLQRFYADGKAPAMETRRVRLRLQLRGRAEDVRYAVDRHVPREIYDANDYFVSQRFGDAARQRVDAIHYDSVRNRKGGHCAAAFRAKVVKKAEIAGVAGLVWDGTRFVESFTIEPL